MMIHKINNSNKTKKKNKNYKKKKNCKMIKKIKEVFCVIIYKMFIKLHLQKQKTKKNKSFNNKWRKYKKNKIIIINY